MKNLIFIIPVLLLIACSSEAEEVIETTSSELYSDEVLLDSADTIITEDILNDTLIQMNLMAENGALIHLDGLSIGIDTLDVWNEDNTGIFNEDGSDTVYIYLGLAYGIGDRDLHLFHEGITDFSIQQRYETSITVMREGPHCDLTDWKHYDSQWTDLKRTGDVIRTKNYSLEQREKFPAINMADAVEEVRKQCGDDWADYSSEAKSPTEYPFGVGLSAFYFKIQYIPPGKASKVTKYVVFQEPMGC